MSLRKPRFEIHKAQKIAATLLLIFLLQALWLLAHLPLSMAETRNSLAGQSLWASRQFVGAGSPLVPGDSVLALRSAGLFPAIANHWQGSGRKFSIYAAPNRWLVRLPFVAFGVWLGAALWWVARRIFGNEGGYVALGLYCFSPPFVLASATADSAILASWGLFGLVFTGIGVAHTLYAPTSKWRPRILLLGLAIGLTAAANLSAAIAGLVLAAAFMLYLAPGRRLASIGILATSSSIGTLVVLLCFSFKARHIAAAALVPGVEYLKLTTYRMTSFMALPGALLEIVVFLACLLVFLLWKRARYFGNAAPLIAALLLPWWPGQFLPGASAFWALPFVFVFGGGVYADLLETNFFAGRFRTLAVISALVMIGASAVFSLMVAASA